MDVWVYGSTLMSPEWAAWGCLGYSEEELKRRCIDRYGRVPVDCVVKKVKRADVPFAGSMELYDLDNPRFDLLSGRLVYPTKESWQWIES